MSTRLPSAGLLIAALLVASCQGRPPARAPALGPAAFVTMLPDTRDRRPAVRLAPTLSSRPSEPAPAPGSAAPPARPAPTAANLVPAVPGARSPAPQGAPPAPGGAAPPPPQGAAAPVFPGAGAKGFTNAATLMAIGRGAFLLPEDFKIGPLGDERAGPADQAKAVETAGRFLTALVAGAVDKDLLAAPSRDAVSEALSFGLQRGNTPTAYRVGRPRTRDDGDVTAAVRLFGHDSSSEGEIYVSQSGSRWLVSDLQLNLEQLSLKVEKPKEKFFPLEYRWLLEE